MTFEDFQNLFVEFSGRYDLVIASNSSGDAIRSIVNNAIKLLNLRLDRQITIEHTLSSPINEVTIEALRSVAKVFISTTAGVERKLSKVSKTVLLRHRLSTTEIMYWGWDSHTQKVLLNAAVAGTLLVTGYEKHVALSSADHAVDDNYYINEHTSLLLKCCMRELESLYRNTEGVRDWENQIITDILDIQKDYWEEEWVDLNSPM